MLAPVSTGAAHELTRVLSELQQVHRELVEQRYVRRADGAERVGEAVGRLGELGSPAGVIARSAGALGASWDFDLVLVSRADDGGIRPQALWVRDDPARADEQLAELARRSIPLGYPLIEAEVAHRHQPGLVSVAASGRRAAPGLAEVLGWAAYGVAGIPLHGRIFGFVHAARDAGPPLDDVDLELIARYAEGLAQVFERAVLREQLSRQRTQLQAAAQWISGRMLDLSAGPMPDRADTGIADPLTARELDVLRLIARGQSNRAIAASLAIGEGTVKYHVKNVLRKLGARSRTEAVSRYARLYGAGEVP